MKKIILFLFLLTSIGTGFAQKDAQAKKILDKAAAAFGSKGGTEIAFSISGAQSMSGTIKVKSNKFVLYAGNMTTWYNGTTQWTYLKNTQEVNITTPTPSQVSQLNPQAWLYSYKNGYNYQYAGKSSGLHKIVLTPNRKGQPVKSIALWIKDGNYAPSKVILMQSNGQSSTITVKKCTPAKYPDSLFQFNPKAYPQAEIIDLR